MRPGGGDRRALGLMLPALTVLLLFFALPYLNMLYMSFMTSTKGAVYVRDFTLENYRTVVADPYYWEIVWRTVRLAALATVLALVLAYPVAYCVARAGGRAKALLTGLLLAPLLVGLVVRSYGWMVLLADTGLVNQVLAGAGIGPLPLMYNETGVLIGLVHVYLPFMVLALSGSLQQVDPDLERAAQSLGAGAWQVFRRVVWPLSLPGVAAGSTLVFVLSMSAYVVPTLLGGYNVITAPLLVVQTVMDLFNWPLGSAMAVVLFIVSVLILALYLKVLDLAIRRLHA